MDYENLLNLILISSKNYTEGILRKDMTTREFFTEQILAFIDEWYEFFEVSDNLTEEYYKTIKKYNIKLYNNIDPALDELADILCFVSNIINYYNFTFDKPLEFNFYNRFLDVPNETKKEWIIRINYHIRTLIRHTDVWKTWKPNNKRKTDGLKNQSTLDDILFIIAKISYKFYKVSDFEIDIQYIYEVYRKKVINNIKKQQNGEIITLDYRNLLKTKISEEEFLISFFNKSGFLIQ